jgi:uncharacterized damage-inducible protein DinB
MRPDQAEFLRNFYAVSFKNEQPITRRVIEAIPEDKASYRPDDIVKSATDLAWHIVLAEHRFMAGVINGAFEYDSTRPDSVKSVRDIAAWYGETFQRDLEQLSTLSGDALLKMVDFRGKFQFPAVVYLQIGLHHTIHHRGQLSMYLRPMGAKVPSIYGESYDATQARLAAQAH